MKGLIFFDFWTGLLANLVTLFCELRSMNIVFCAKPRGRMLQKTLNKYWQSDYGKISRCKRDFVPTVLLWQPRVNSKIDQNVISVLLNVTL